jgi:hypothetical protein
VSLNVVNIIWLVNLNFYVKTNMFISGFDIHVHIFASKFWFYLR